jgi:hypothetical protein
MSTFIDLLTDERACKRDIPYLVRLGINSIYITDVDQLSSHDACMNAFRDAGIYVFIQLNGLSTRRTEIGDLMSYGVTYSDVLRASIDTFQKYSNTLGFLIRAGDSVEDARNLPYEKSSVRGLKDYIEEKGYRKIPVGMGRMGPNISRLAIADYLNCGEMSHSIDFIALASWCDDMIQQLQSRLVDDWRGYSVPTYIHYGCPASKPVDFKQVPVLYNNITTAVFSGGVVHDWIDSWSSGVDAG